MRVIKIDSKSSFTFEYIYELDFKDSLIYQYVLLDDIQKDQPIHSLINDILTVRLEDDSTVIMSYICEAD